MKFFLHSCLARATPYRSRLDRIMVYARGVSNMANHYARNRTFCAQTFANLDCPNTSGCREPVWSETSA